MYTLANEFVDVLDTLVTSTFSIYIPISSGSFNVLNTSKNLRIFNQHLLPKDNNNQSFQLSNSSFSTANSLSSSNFLIISPCSCPTCGRTKIDLIGLASKVEELVRNYDLDIKIAVMGCVVNGPGEAKEADIGIAGGDGCGVLIKHGEIIKKFEEDKLLAVLKDELDNWKD